MAALGYERHMAYFRVVCAPQPFMDVSTCLNEPTLYDPSGRDWRTLSEGMSGVRGARPVVGASGIGRGSSRGLSTSSRGDQQIKRAFP